MKRKFSTVQNQSDRIINDLLLSFMASETLESVMSLYSNRLKKAELKTSKFVEIGSAGGVTKSLNPFWITTDIRSAKGVDIIASALI